MSVMRRRHWTYRVVAVVCLLGFSSAYGFPPQTPAVIGQVVVSSGATQNGVALPSGGTVFDGDVISTGPTGNIQIKLSPTNQVTLNEDTSVAFSRVLEQTRMQLQKGTVVVQGAENNLVAVVTPKFRIEPPISGTSKVYVGLMADNSTYIESAEGDTIIVDTATGKSYVLSAGQNALVPENATGIPGLEPQNTTVASNPAPNPPATETPAAQPPASQPPSNPLPKVTKTPTHGSGALIGVVVAAAAAGGIAAAAGGGGGSSSGGGGSRPSSPSVP